MPRSIAIAHSLDFLGFYLPKPPARVLEVGCGRGDLARELMRLGYEVAAIDTSADAIAAAKANGVKASVCDILAYADESEFDGILFTHSLHHISPLDAALSKAKSLLRTGGVGLIEEFAWEVPDAATLLWEHSVKRLLGDSDAKEIPSNEALVNQWRKDHHHAPSLHTGEKIREAVRKRFPRHEAGECPYLYRSAVRLLEGKPRAVESIIALLQWETRLIEDKAIKPIGLRIAAYRQ